MEALVHFLIAEVRVMERGSDSGKREVKEQIPSDKVKDAPALARELRWRLRLVINGTSDDETEVKKRGKLLPSSGATNLKRKRSNDTVAVDIRDLKPEYKNFVPKTWQGCQKQAGQVERWNSHAVEPQETDSQWAERWMDWEADRGGDDSDEVHIERKSEVIVKVRRTPTGIERQRVERLNEIWDWHGMLVERQDQVPGAANGADPDEVMEDRQTMEVTSASTA